MCCASETPVAVTNVQKVQHRRYLVFSILLKDMLTCRL